MVIVIGLVVVFSVLLVINCQTNIQILQLVVLI